MKYLILFFFIAVTQPILGQTDTTKQKHWFPSTILGINLSQVAFKDWSQGGEDALAWTLTLNGGLKYVDTNFQVINNIKAAYGQTKLGGQDIKITDNEIYIENIFILNLGWVTDPFFSNTIRTPITKGYNYKDDSKEEIANFFDPAYVTQTIGFTYQNGKIFKTRLGIALQETFTDKYRKYSDDLKTKDKMEAFKLQSGIESTSSLQLTIDKNVIWKSDLRLFSTFEQIDVWDVRWDNIITGAVNNHLNVMLNFQLLYQESQTKKLQLKEGIQIGITYKII